MPSYKTGQQLLDEARARVSEISARNAISERASKPDVVFLDIREQPPKLVRGERREGLHVLLA